MGRLFLDPRLVGAAFDGDTTQTKKMLAYGADVHAWDDAALRVAAGKGHTVVVAILIGEGADIHARDDEALLLAEKNGHTETAKFIRDALEKTSPGAAGINRRPNQPPCP